MKHIKTFENLDKPKKYLLEECYLGYYNIWKIEHVDYSNSNLCFNIRKIYKYDSQGLIKMNDIIINSVSLIVLLDGIIYQSDTLDFLNNIETIINAKKYNL